MTDFTTTYFDPTSQIGNLAEAVKLLTESAYREGFWAVPEARDEAIAIVATIARLRKLHYPEPVETSTGVGV